MATDDRTGRDPFVEYYAEASLSPRTMQRIRSIRDRVLEVIRERGLRNERLAVADVGCGAGTQSILWAEMGHRVSAIDVNQALVEIARTRASDAGHDIDFHVGSAVALPWADGSMDVCLNLELLEHIAEWRESLEECVRVLAPGGVLFLSTSNMLCPVQQEFNLPMYSWYPAPLKRRYERLATTTRPDLANYAKYPAVNWFSFYGLRSLLRASGFTCLDRFDIMDLSTKGAAARLVVRLVRGLPPLRFLGHVATSGTTVLAIRNAPARGPAA